MLRVLSQLARLHGIKNAYSGPELSAFLLEFEQQNYKNCDRTNEQVRRTL